MGRIVPSGYYRHFKGNLYHVICVGKHTETEETLVCYQNAHELFGTIWIRPLSMWDEEVEHEGKKVKRFTPMEQPQ